MDIPERIQAIARINHLSMSELAEKVGIHKATLHTYVKGAAGRKPAKLPVELVSNFLNAFPSLSIEWIVLGIGEMYVGESVIQEIGLAKESNVDYKEKYYELSEKVISLQDELNMARLDLINCLKAKIKMTVHSGSGVEVSGLLG